MAQHAMHIAEGHSINRPPYFSGEDYAYWRDRMKLFIEYTSLDMWEIIQFGDYIPTEDSPENVFAGDDLPQRVIPRNRWTDAHKAKVQLNSKAKYLLTCALSKSEYDKIIACDTAKEIWDRLQLLHEGTDQVKETKISMLVHQYEMFKMLDLESIDDMTTRFMHIINLLKGLGKIYTNAEMVRKILRSLPAKWLPKVTAITEAKDLKTLSLDALIGSLKTHEIELNEVHGDSSKKGKAIALKSSHKKPSQSKAFKVSDESEDEEVSEEDSDEDSDDISLLVRKMSRAWKNKLRRKGNFINKDKKGKAKIENVTCYNCGKKGHFKTDCPKLKEGPKKAFPKKKSLLATWDDSDSDKAEEEQQDELDEVANLCFMADYASSEEAEVISQPETEFTYEELLSMYDELLQNSQILTKAYKNQKRAFSKTLTQNKELILENEKLKHDAHTLQKEKSILENNTHAIRKELSEKLQNAQKEHSDLQKVSALLKTDLEKLVNGSKNLDLMLGGLRPYGQKSGLGFEENASENSATSTSKQKKHKNFCGVCCKKGHVSDKCKLIQKAHIKKKTVHTTKANPKGPKKIWVPKLKLVSDTGMPKG